MLLNSEDISQFLVGSYGLGWAIVARLAIKSWSVDLCQFIRSFVLSPILFALLMIVLMAAYVLMFIVIIPNLKQILIGIAIIISVCCTIGVIGYFVIRPTINKAIGVAKPISSKLCIVLYRRKQ